MLLSAFRLILHKFLSFFRVRNYDIWIQLACVARRCERTELHDSIKIVDLIYWQFLVSSIWIFLISFMFYNSINFSGHNPTITGTKFYILIRRSESRKRAKLPRFACTKSFFKSEACLIQMNIKNIILRNFSIPNSFINFVLASRRTTVEAPRTDVRDEFIYGEKRQNWIW